PELLEGAAAAGELLRERLAFVEGSGGERLSLIERGIATATDRPAHVLIGTGYGTSHLFLGDFFFENDYGNYHSLPVTFFAEAGVFAVLLVLGLFVAVVRAPSAYRPLLVGVL